MSKFGFERVNKPIDWRQIRRIGGRTMASVGLAVSPILLAEGASADTIFYVPTTLGIDDTTCPSGYSGFDPAGPDSTHVDVELSGGQLDPNFNAIVRTSTGGGGSVLQAEDGHLVGYVGSGRVTEVALSVQAGAQVKGVTVSNRGCVDEGSGVKSVSVERLPQANYNIPKVTVDSYLKTSGNVGTLKANAWGSNYDNPLNANGVSTFTPTAPGEGRSARLLFTDSKGAVVDTGVVDPGKSYNVRIHPAPVSVPVPPTTPKPTGLSPSGAKPSVDRAPSTLPRGVTRASGEVITSTSHTSSSEIPAAVAAPVRSGATKVTSVGHNPNLFLQPQPFRVKAGEHVNASGVLVQNEQLGEHQYLYDKFSSQDRRNVLEKMLNLAEGNPRETGLSFVGAGLATSALGLVLYRKRNA